MPQAGITSEGTICGEQSSFMSSGMTGGRMTLRTFCEPAPIQPPQVLRHPDAVYGSALFRPATGGEAVIYTNDSSQVISGDGGGALRCFDDNQLVPRQALFSEAMGHRTMIHAVATSPDGSLLAAESNSTIRLWNLRKREPVGEKMCGHTYGIADMKFSPDGRLLASGTCPSTLIRSDRRRSRWSLIRRECSAGFSLSPRPRRSHRPTAASSCCKAREWEREC